jgi:perosamine synthetase
MNPEWSPYPRYRLYTQPAGYWIVLRNLSPFSDDTNDLVGALEREICRRFGVNAAVCVPMARTGIYLALNAMIQPGQTVIMSPLTIIDVVNMVILAGGIPLFADICRQSCGLDPSHVESLIDSRTGAVLITHLHGESAGAHVFRGICRAKKVPLIEDAAQAFGALEDGCRLGTIGDVGVYSFGFYKNVNAWQGGMLVSNDTELIARIRRKTAGWMALSARRLFSLSLRGLLTDVATWPPLFATLIHKVLRFSQLHDIHMVNRKLDPEAGAKKLRAMPNEYLNAMTDSQATMVLNQVHRVDTDTGLRLARAARYHESLAGLDGLVTPRWPVNGEHIFTYYPIQLPLRDTLLRFALTQGRDVAAQHLRNCADLPEFEEYHRDCPAARMAARDLVLLPTYPRYPMREVERNIKVIEAFLKSR